jgi:hypothetical protein
VKHKGRVIGRYSNIVASGVVFIVSAKGRDKVLVEKKKYVHAYVVCDSFESVSEEHIEFINTMCCLDECYYNPYKQDCFTVLGEKITSCLVAYLAENKVFVDLAD